MKNKKGKQTLVLLKNYFLSISVLIISMLACCFIFAEKTQQVFAMDTTSQECYYLIDQTGNPYEANVPVGKIEGLGKFVVGEKDVILTATAYSNYQVKGWLLTYKQQDNKQQYISEEDLIDGQINLLAKDGVTEICATLTFVQKDNVIQSATFQLENVFEHLTISPVFDHVYYNVDITELIKLSTFENSIVIGEDILFYESSSTDGDVTTYFNSYINVGESYFYYGELCEKDGNYYTTHKTLNADEQVQNIDYKNGAFRVGDEININFDVDIDETEVKLSKNIDFISASVIGDSTLTLTQNTSSEIVSNSYKLTKDDFLRTTNYELSFNLISDKNQKNIVEIAYHDLYVVDLSILIDGESEHNQTADIFGETTVKTNEIISNISIYNFYSRTKDDNLQFLIKKAQDNNAKAFILNCSQTVGKVNDGIYYKFYDFAMLNGVVNLSLDYSNISQNTTVTIEYTSTKYQISFMCAEYVKDSNGEISLGSFIGNVLDSFMLKRGEVADLTPNEVKDINNVGYKFVGYSKSLDGPVEENVSYTVDLLKPQGTTIYICFEKLEYNIVFTNYNKEKIGELTALKSVLFTINQAGTTTSQKYYTEDLVGESVTLNNKIKINDSLQITTIANEGFEVLGYSLKSPENSAEAEFYDSFVFDADFITANNIENIVTIYVYESSINYSLTYYIEQTQDNKLSQNVIMAQIDVVGDGKIQKYDAQGQLISAENNNTTALVAKIVISELKLQDEVVLFSEGITIGEGEDEYSYVFNWFTEDNKSTLSYTKNENIYSHTEVILRNRSIKVVYSMPSTKLFISVEEELSKNEDFSYNYTITSNGTELQPDEENGNVFTIEVGLTVSITIGDVVFGYNFMGYKHVEENYSENVSGLAFNYVTKVGVNTIELNFDQIQYHFIFTQFGASYNGELINFDGKDYASLDVDHRTITIEKPLGYYVSKVVFANSFADYSTKLSETNDFRSNGDMLNYQFALEREDFINLVTNYASVNGLNISEVKVRLEYSIFTYRVQVNYGITNPKGGSLDSFVSYPPIELLYEYDGKTKSALVDPTAEINTIVFYNIPYNSKATISLIGGATAGLSLSGWVNADGGPISQHTHSLDYLIIDNVIEDKIFGYNLTYIAYHVNVVFVSEQGNPATYINSMLVTASTKQITLFDKLEIVANPSRANGYVFDKITYKTPLYTEFVFSEEVWNEEYSRLYVLSNGTYKLNTSSIYDENIKYYVFSEKVEVCEESTFTDESFMVSDYALNQDRKTINFVVEYKLLQLTIENNISQIVKDPINHWSWSMTSRGSNGAKIEFDLEDLALITISAKDSNSVERNINEGDTVNFYDTVFVKVEINKQAVNAFDSTNYDLSLGLTLSSVTISNKTIMFSGSQGEYSFEFYVGEYFPSKDVIKISYKLLISPKNVNVTTIVKNSTSFYQNVKLYINAYKYSFHGSSVSSVQPASSVNLNLQFLAKANIYATFTSKSYKENFVVSGVKIYVDGTEILPVQYAEYGVVLNEDNSIDVRMFRDLNVEFIVQPKISYNNGPIYTKTFICDNMGNGQAQSLSIGSASSSDIQVDSMLAESISVKYLSTEPNSIYTNDVTNVGSYKVLIAFKNTESLDWLSEISVAEEVVLNIKPKEIVLTYDDENIVQTSKTYDKTSNYNVSNIFKYLVFKDNGTLNIKYSDILSASGNNLVLASANCYISSAGKDAEITTANEAIYYNLYVYDCALKLTKFNNNFILQKTDLIIYNYIKITKREIKLHNINVFNKVYDGTDKAELISTENISISNIISGDEVSLNISRLTPRFNDSSVGTNKSVLLDATSALVGKDVGNYYIKGIETQGLTIYPYSLSVTINGHGTIEVLNMRGLTEKDKVDLIPLNATLNVEPVYAETQEYISIYGKISKHLKGNNEYAMGYKLSFMVNGESVPVDNDLYLSIPNVKNLTGTYFLTGNQTGSLDYEKQDENMLIDLSQIDGDISHVFLTKTKILLKAWQIVLIIVGIVLIISLIVLILIIVRKRKQGRDSVHEKI